MRGSGLSIVFCAAIGAASVSAVAGPRGAMMQTANGPTFVAAREAPKYFEPATRCAAPYHAALENIDNRLGKRLADLAKFLNTPSLDLPGRWLVPDAPGRRSAGFDGDKFVDGNKQCANLVRRAGRIRCMKWEPLTYDPVVEAQRPVVPDPTPEEIQTYQLLEPWMRSRGAGAEFRYEGRFVWATTKLAEDFKSYIGQPPHPALCSGAEQVVEVFSKKIRGLRERIAEVEATAATIRQQALARLAQLRAVAAQSPASETHVANAATGPAATSRDLGDRSVGEPADLAAWVDTVAALATTREQADAVRAISKPLEKLKQALGYLRPKQATPVAREIRAEGIATLRAAEATFYADVMVSRFHEIDEVFIGSIDGAQRAYSTNCTCSN